MKSTQDTLDRFFAEINRARKDLEQDVPGWHLYQPPLSEVDDTLAFVIATGKPGERRPFIPPSRSQIAIAVKSGAVCLDSRVGVISAPGFYVLAANENHEITPLSDGCVLVCMFFRTEAGERDGRTVDSR